MDTVLECALRSEGFRYLAGVDEAGRGPLAGPVVACACVMPQDHTIEGIKDSKALTPKARKKLFWKIIEHGLIGIGVVSEQEIDRLNILRASLTAMVQAVLALPVTPDILLIDGHLRIDLPVRQLPVVRGDKTVQSISAASIVAKVVRDEMMIDYDVLFPGYGFAVHKGYPTQDHLARLQNLGPSPIHRKTFGPVERVTSSREEDIYEHADIERFGR